jgi:hypothetical protein
VAMPHARSSRDSAFKSPRDNGALRRFLSANGAIQRRFVSLQLDQNQFGMRGGELISF